MAPYEARFVTHGNRVFDTERFEAASDERAIGHARAVFACGVGRGYELWSEGRCVHTELFGGQGLAGHGYQAQIPVRSVTGE